MKPPAARRRAATSFLFLAAVALAMTAAAAPPAAKKSITTTKSSGTTTSKPAPAADAPPPTPGEQPAPGEIALSERPINVQSLGMSIRLPIGAHYETTRMTGASAAFTMASPDNSWRLQLHNPTSRDQNLDATGVSDSLIKELLEAREQRQANLQRKTEEVVGSGTKIIDRVKNLEINGFKADRFYATVPDTDANKNIACGYTVFQVGPGRFAILQMDCLESTFAASRKAYETVVATAEFRDPADMAAERAAGIRAADGFLNSLNKDDFLAALPKDELWHRIYRPAPAGARADATEVAWQKTVMKVGKRGELDPQKTPNRYTQADQQQGYLVSVFARFLDGTRFVDCESVFFLSFDRSEESWAIRMNVKEGKNQSGYTETGVRLGDDLKIQINRPDSTPVEKSWKRPPEAYLSQVEKFLLPRLLAKKLAEPAVLNFYCYQSVTTDLPIRRDVLEPAPGQGHAVAGGQSGEGAPIGAWILRSRPDENAAEDSTLINAEGDIIRRDMSNGAVMEPMDVDSLKKLWKSKGLKMS